jgi:hypothetical protein
MGHSVEPRRSRFTMGRWGCDQKIKSTANNSHDLLSVSLTKIKICQWNAHPPTWSPPEYDRKKGSKPRWRMEALRFLVQMKGRQPWKSGKLCLVRERTLMKRKGVEPRKTPSKE